MIFLNKGYYYDVYDLENGRIRKVEKRFFRKITDAYFFEDRKILNWLLACYAIFKGKKNIREAYAKIKRNVHLETLGNPIFLKGIDYEHDKVEIVGTYLDRVPAEEGKRIIDSYIQNIFESWRQGFSDRVYNFTINNGIDKNSSVILIDFNEVIVSKDEVMSRIESKRWLRASSYIHLNPLYKEYYRQKMESSMTQENLELFWKN